MLVPSCLAQTAITIRKAQGDMLLQLQTFTNMLVDIAGCLEFCQLLVVDDQKLSATEGPSDDAAVVLPCLVHRKRPPMQPLFLQLIAFSL